MNNLQIKKIDSFKKVISIDPSGEKGTMGVCLINYDTKQVISFQENYANSSLEQIEWLINLIKKEKPDIITYELTGFIDPKNTDRKRIISLFEVIGVIKSLVFYFDFIEKVEHVYVNQVKAVRTRLIKKILCTKDISLEVGAGKGWIYTCENGEKIKISSHQLDALIVYKLWIKEIEPLR